MTALDDSIRKVIEQSVVPRLAAHRTYLAAALPDPIPVARADLIYLWDEYRTEYLDFASLGHPVGHAHPIITRAVADHHRYYGHTAPQGRHALRWPIQYATDLSAQFTYQEMIPRQVLFTEGEREAVSQAVRFAGRGTPGEVVTVGGDYRWLACPQAYYPDTFDPTEAAWDRASVLLLNLAFPDGRVLSTDTARRWMAAARDHQVPVIVDETVTGFGRLGRMWGHTPTGLAPDYVVLGGPAGGGYPLGAVIAAPASFTGRPVHDVSSQAANPIACTAGSSLMTAIGLGTLEYMAESCPLFVVSLDQLAEQFGGHLHGHHGEGHLRGLRMASPELASRLVADARSQGLYLAPPVGDTVVLAPVLITSSNELTRAVDILASVMLDWG